MFLQKQVFIPNFVLILFLLSKPPFLNHKSTMTKRLFTLLLFIFITFCTASAQGWERLYGSTRTDNPTGITATSDGGFLLCGFSIEATTTKQDISLIKTDADGQLQWSKTIGKAGITEQAYGLVKNPDGTFLVLGIRYMDAQNMDGQAWIIKMTARQKYHHTCISSW